MHVALENFLSEPDGLLGGLGMNNFYLYRFENTTLSQMIVWDQDLAFEWLDRPAPRDNFAMNVLASKIWASPVLRARYLTALVEIANSVGPPPGTSEVVDASTRQCPAPEGEPACGWLEQEIFTEYAQIREAALADPRTPHTNEQFEEGIEFLKRFARERGGLVRQYIATLESGMDPSSEPRSSDRRRFPYHRVLTPQ
jgi:hypothetical protein